MTQSQTCKVDFHLHSYASNVTDYYAANTFSIPESYSDPLDLHRLLKARGMDLVTLTDHNSIDGCKALLDRGFDDVFISAEMTTTFPEDGCNVHVTVANMTEAQFREIDRLRGNIYEMLGFLDAQIASEAEASAGNRLGYFMTHPLMSTQNRPYGREGSLSVAHIEKCLLLLNCFEVRNGTRTRALNEFTVRLLESLDRDVIADLANKHGIEPKGQTPWLKATLAGSDDHCGINPGRTWSEFQVRSGRPADANAVIEAMRLRAVRPAGAHGGPTSLAHAMVKLLYDGKKQAQAQGRKTLAFGGALHGLLRFVFDSQDLSLREKAAFRARAFAAQFLEPRLARLRRSRDRSFEKILTCEARALLTDRAFLDRLGALERTDDRIFTVVSGLVNRIFAHYGRRIAQVEKGDIVRAIKEAVALATSHLFVSMPYLLSYFSQSGDRCITRDVRKAFALEERQRLALVTDTFFDVNGVAKTIRKMMVEARRRDIDFTVVTCLDAEEYAQHARDPEIQEWIAAGRLKIFQSVVSVALPEYKGLQLRFPPFLEMLHYLQEAGFTKMQISTPGIVGLAGLLAAKTLQMETSSTYHTSFPEYVEDYTKDISLEALTWKYMILFYHSVDEVVVPSKFIARLLHERGLRNRKLLILDRWVDDVRFHPKKRAVGYWRRFGLEQEEQLVKFVYVGRLGVEKNLAQLAEAYLRLRETRPDAHLILIGDGPFQKRLQELLGEAPATFTGFLQGEELATALASGDVKVFPSTTDTWGNAPLEAQSCGLPVIVSDRGGPQELMVDGQTGIRIVGRCADSLHDAMARLMDGDLRRRMGTAARAFVEEHRLERPFTAILDSDAYRENVKRQKRAATTGSVGSELRIHYHEDAFAEPAMAADSTQRPSARVGAEGR